MGGLCWNRRGTLWPWCHGHEAAEIQLCRRGALRRRLSAPGSPWRLEEDVLVEVMSRKQHGSCSGWWCWFAKGVIDPIQSRVGINVGIGVGVGGLSIRARQWVHGRGCS